MFLICSNIYIIFFSSIIYRRTYALEEDGLHVIFDMGTTLNPEVHPHLHHILKKIEA